MGLRSTEQWRPVPGYEGTYEVSDQGRVRSLDRTITDYDGRIRRFRGRAVKSWPNPASGRRQVRLSQEGRARTYRVASLVLSAFVGPRPPGKETCHNDGRRTNDALTNLRYDTSGNNHRDKVRHGTHNEASKTHCPRNHPYTSENTHLRPDRPTTRECLACRRAANDVRRAKRAEQPHDFVRWADEHYRRITATHSPSSSSASVLGLK